MVRKADFDTSVPLPPGLDIASIRRAIDYIERELADLIDVYFEQANIFSALVGIYGTKALDSLSNYEKHRHIDTAQQRFPDLRRRGSGNRPSPKESLEARQVNVRGLFNRTTIMPGGTSFGAIWLSLRNPWHLGGQS